jgi:hypothetical protein
MNSDLCKQNYFILFIRLLENKNKEFDRINHYVFLASPALYPSFSFVSSFKSFYASVITYWSETILTTDWPIFSISELKISLVYGEYECFSVASVKMFDSLVSVLTVDSLPNSLLKYPSGSSVFLFPMILLTT